MISGFGALPNIPLAIAAGIGSGIVELLQKNGQ